MKLTTTFPSEKLLCNTHVCCVNVIVGGVNFRYFRGIYRAGIEDRMLAAIPGAGRRREEPGKRRWGGDVPCSVTIKTVMRYSSCQLFQFPDVPVSLKLQSDQVASNDLEKRKEYLYSQTHGFKF